MSFILNIDTASEIARVNIAEDGKIIQEEKNPDQKDHAAFLQPAIQLLIKKAFITLQDIAAVAVVNGPGSYTGLRVGMASAKGLCFALNIPLITIGSLEVLTTDFIRQQQNKSGDVLFCPMIDARRMEVFTAVYDHQLNMILPPCAMILHVDAYANILLNNKTAFFGTGAKKWEQICTHSNALILAPPKNCMAMSELCYEKFLKKDFADIAYTEPFYLKDFYTG